MLENGVGMGRNEVKRHATYRHTIAKTVGPLKIFEILV